MAIGIQKHVVGLDVSVDNVLSVDVAQGTAELCDPKPYGRFGKRLSRDMETQITAAHEVNNQVPGPLSAYFSANVELGGDIHVLDILEAVSQVTDKGVVDMFEHSPFSDYISDTLGSYN